MQHIDIVMSAAGREIQQIDIVMSAAGGEIQHIDIVVSAAARNATYRYCHVGRERDAMQHDIVMSAAARVMSAAARDAKYRYCHVGSRAR